MIFMQQLTWRLVLRFIITIGLGFASAWTAAHEGEDGHEHAPPAADANEVYQPPVVPDRIILTWTGDPATTQSVTSRTSFTLVKRAGDINQLMEQVPATAELRRAPVASVASP